MPISIRYNFCQRFPVSPKQAYLWCTDFSSQDLQLMGYRDAKRQVVYVSEGVIILKDVFSTPNGEIEKQKMVHLYPDKLNWFSTHLFGSSKYSQFQYTILPENGGCHLNYEALHVEHEKDNLTSDEQLQFADLLYKSDLVMWKLLASVMAQELI